MRSGFASDRLRDCAGARRSATSGCAPDVLMKQGLFPNCRMRDPFPALDDQDRKEIDEVFAAARFEDPRFLPAGKRV